MGVVAPAGVAPVVFHAVIVDIVFPVSVAVVGVVAPAAVVFPAVAAVVVC